MDCRFEGGRSRVSRYIEYLESLEATQAGVLDWAVSLCKEDFMLLFSCEDSKEV